MDLQEIRKIVELMNEHGLTMFDMSKKDFTLTLKKGADAEDLRALLASLPAPVAAAPAALPAVASSAPATQPAAAPVPAGDEITSPMVGTFYRKPAPDADSFVDVGTKISEGQTICIIEAMKVMNEIKAEKSGTISECPIEDGQPVQYGDTLFRIL